MKRIIFSLCLFLMLIIPINADESRVIDKADILTTNEEISINEEIVKLKFEHNIDFVLYVDSEEVDSVKYAAADIYDYGSFDKQGVMLYINMANREYFALTTGDDVIYRLTDFALDEANNEMAYYLKDGYFYDGILSFFSSVDSSLEYYYENGKPYDNSSLYEESKADKISKNLTMSFVVSTLITSVVAFVLVNQLKSVKRKEDASDYTSSGNDYCKANITKSRDSFLYRTITRVKIQRNNNGGSSTFRGSSGTSHGGRGGSF